MLSRFISRSSHIRLLTLVSSNTSFHPPLPHPPPRAPLFSNPFFSNPNSIFPIGKSRCFSTNRNDNGDNSSKDPWNFSSQNDDNVESLFVEEIGDLEGVANRNRSFEEGSKGVVEDAWSLKEDGDPIGEIEKEFELEKGSGGRVDEWETAKDYKPWSFGDEEKSEVFDIGDVATDVILNVRDEQAERKLAEENAQLDKEKQELSVQLKGPNRAFGDLIAASGITDEMIDSLILLQDVAGIEGLPPLSEIEDIRLQKNEKKITRAELERKKQEEIAKSRVRQVDEKGRAYGTGRRKCSVARVWVEPGDGKFVINDKPFDTYFPILDHRAELLRPFSETKTLGLWDVKCTVKGGGVSGQVGAVRLGISRALQNWEPGLRPNLRAAGFLTRDSRVVERKKPGKAKARKSFQWVKR